MKNIYPYFRILSGILFLALISLRSYGAIFTVTTNADSGSGSLRQILAQANITPELDNINFNIPGSTTANPAVISLASHLPYIVYPVIMDGGNRVQLVGNHAVDGIVIKGAAAGTEIKQMIFKDMTGQTGGRSIDYTGIITIEVNNCKIIGNTILGPTDFYDYSTNSGILIRNADNIEVTNNTISKVGTGIDLFRCIGRIYIKGNTIGKYTPNANYSGVARGVLLNKYTQDNCYLASKLYIGGNQSGEGNTVVNCTAMGLDLSGSNITTVIKGNYIGVDQEGNTDAPQFHSILLYTNDAQGQTSRSYIGDTTQYGGNTIYYGNHDAMDVSRRSSISGNIIYSNEAGPYINAIWSREYDQVLKAAPKISLSRINSTLFRADITSLPGDTVELFGGDGPQNARRYISYGVADAAGKVSLNVSMNAGETVILGTARDGDGNTSELGLAEEVALCAENDFTWAKQLSRGHESYNADLDIAVDAQGNTYTIGTFDGMATIGGYSFYNSGSGPNGFLTKYNANGKLIRLQQLLSAGGDGSVQPKAITTDKQGNIYITGTFQGDARFTEEFSQYYILEGPDVYDSNNEPNNFWDIFIAKLDPNGNVIWAKRSGSNAGAANDITVDSQGNAYIAGYFKGTASFGSGNVYTSTGLHGDHIIAKYNASGNITWVEQVAKTNTQSSFKKIGLDGSGNYYVSGFLGQTISFGNHTLTASSGSDGFVVKYNSSGSSLWAKQLYRPFPANDANRAIDLAVDSSGVSYVAGNFKTSTGLNLVTSAKLTASGSVEWSKNTAIHPLATSYDIDLNIHSVALDASSNVYISSSYNGEYERADNDVVKVYKYAQDGNLVWKKAVIGENSGEFYYEGNTGYANYKPLVASNSMAVNASGNDISLTGNFRTLNIEDIIFASSISFDSVMLSTDRFDYSYSTFISKICPNVPNTIIISAVSEAPFCAGTPVSISLTKTGIFGGNLIAELSELNSTDFLENSIQIGSITSGNTISGTLPANLASGTYYIRVKSGKIISNLFQVVVPNTLPEPAFTSTITGNSACTGNTITYAVVTPVSNYVYTWTVSGANTATGSGNTFTYAFANAGSTTVTLTATRYGCSSSKPQYFNVKLSPTLTVNLIKGTTCSQANDGSLRFVTNGDTYSLLRNGSIYQSTTNITTSTITIANLPSGTYQVMVNNVQGCSTISNPAVIEDGSPVVTTCTNYLFCNGSAAILRFNVDYPTPPDNFSGEYLYRVLKGTTVVVSDTLPESASNPWDYTVSIPNADTISTYTLELSALVNGDSCNCLQPYCKKEAYFQFKTPPSSLTVNTSVLVDSKPTYYICTSGTQTDVGVIISSILNDCSENYEGYRLSLKKDNAIPVVLKDTTGSFALIEYTRTLQLGAGSYLLEAQLGTGNYQCTKTVAFEVKILDLTLTVNTTPADCKEGATATAAISGATGQIDYYWYKMVGSTVTDTLDADGSQVSGLMPGLYQLKVSIPDAGSTCVRTTNFNVISALAIDEVLISQNGCNVKAKATVPVSGSYRVDWHRYDTLATGVRDSLLVSAHLNLSAGDSISQLLPEAYLLDSAFYYADIYNAEGCKVSSAVTLLKKPKVERLYQLCLIWKTPEPKPTPPIASTVQRGPVIAATDIREAIEEKVEQCVVQQTAIAKVNFEASCTTDSTMSDVLSLTYPQNYHHYTLYYYDRAGNLSRTVPPAGVRPLTGVNLTRDNHPAHEYVTTYDYNSLGQLVRQYTPDGDTTHFVYNNLGQLRFSQNARQRSENTYSYTKYDNLGRVTQVGQANKKTGHTTFPNFNLPSVNATNDTLMTKDKLAQEAQKYPKATDALLTEKTLTVYSEPKAGVGYFGIGGQRHLQNRVSYTYTFNLADSTKGVYTYYSYDPHGNVEWLVQEIPGFERKYTAYEYDLISGKVLKVKYNEFAQDKFFHRYSYDEDNRLTGLETSTDGYIWDKDATYAYYDHGPIKRMGIGEDNIQGVDYTYTIHGWLKGMNAPAADTLRDIGRDGSRQSEFSKDEWGMVLNYYKGDYAHKGSVFDAASSTVNKYNLAPEKDLYNGNIAAWVNQVNASPVSGTPAKTEGHQYTYDRLNRLKASKHTQFATTDSSWKASTALKTNYSYDGNGNLLTLNRYDENGASLDSLEYSYNTASTRKNNRLEQVTDKKSATPYKDDLEGTSAYEYDKIGNLTKDVKEGVSISWNVYGKVSEVKPLSGSTKPHITYLYDASGNRISKRTQKTGIDKKTLYVRDASGNPMAIYEKNLQGSDTLTRLIEQPIYGSDRVGMRQETVYLGSAVENAGKITSYQWTKISGPAAVLSDVNTPTLSLNGLQIGTYLFRLSVSDQSGATAYDEVTLSVKEDPLTKGLMGYWPLNETSGTIAYDASGIGRNGTLINGPAWSASGKVGGALEMVNNQSKYVNMPNFIWQPGSFTVAWWINPYSLADFNQQILATTWGKFAFHTSATGEIYVGTDQTNRLSNVHLPAGTVKINQWQHFVFTFEAGVGKFYKNGQLLASKAGLLNPTEWSTFSIGSTGTGSMHGKIDEVRIYNRALSNVDVASLAAWNNGAVTPAPVNAGTLAREYWANHTGSIATIPVNTSPTLISQINIGESPSNVADNYGARLRGYVLAPTTGNYTFYIAGDESCELWLSSDANPANKTKIAFSTAPTGVRTWTTFTSQQSLPIPLQAGNKYYLEVLHKEATGADYVAVGWQLPGGTQERPIPGTRLSPYTTPIVPVNQPPVVSITAPAKNAAFAVSDSMVIDAAAIDPDGRIDSVEFFANGLKLAKDSLAPYRYIWKNLSAGSYRITAKATDSTGISTISDAVTVLIGSGVVAATPTVNAGPDQAIALSSGSATLTGSAKASGATQSYFARSVGNKTYELKDHLGDVRVLVADTKEATVSLSDTIVSIALKAALRGYYHYYPFGMLTPNGTYTKADTVPSVNSGLSFTSNAITNTGAAISSLSNSFTIEAWVNPSSAHQVDVEATTGTSGVSTTNEQRYLIYPAQGDGLGTGHVGVGISVGTNGVSVYEHRSNYVPALLVWSGTGIISGWTHIAVVYENKQPRLYVNGNLVKVGKTSTQAFVHPSYSFSGGLAAYGTYIGSVDEIRIWSSVRTQAEIAANRSKTVSASAYGLAGYWPLDEGAGTIAKDKTANGRHRTLAGATWLAPSTAPIELPQLIAGYRYGYNGKEMDNESGTGNSYDYGFRIYNPRIAKFLSVDPLTKKYPWYTPYQFAGNMPIRFIDLDGLEPAEPGAEKGEYRVATKQGTNQEFGYTWSVGDNKKGTWNQGSILNYANGSVTRKQADAENDAQGDLQSGEGTDALPYPNFTIRRLDWNFTHQLEGSFTFGVMAGTSATDRETGSQLVDHFMTGGGRDLILPNGSTISNEIARDSRFLNFARTFENQALNYYKDKGTLDGFMGANILRNRPNFSGITTNLFLATAIGGTQGIKAQIRLINSNEIRVNYTFYDAFGAGRNDAERWQFPGLQAMYVLQHYRNVDPESRNMYRPYLLGININRTRTPRR